MTEEPHQLDPVSVAIHYKKAADFWESQAKSLLDQVLKIERRVQELEAKNAD